jgi:outer membrane protein TolC
VTTHAALDLFMRFLSLEAVDHSPEVARLEASLASRQRLLLSFKRKRFIPVVSVDAQGRHIFSRQGEGVDFPGTDPPDDSWSTTLNMTWPLFQGGGIASNIRKTEIEIRKIEDQKLKLVRNIRITVRTALFDVVNKDVNLDNAKRSADFASKSLSLVRDGYETGKSSLTELVDAQNAALTAGLAALNSEYDFLVSLLTLERSIGHFALLNSMEENQAYLDRMEDFFARQKDELPLN